MSETEWREIPGYEGYRASRDGRILGKRGRLLHPHVLMNSARIGVRVDWKPSKFTIAEVRRLIWLAFVGPIDPDHRLTNLDGDPLNNDLSNIGVVRAGTHSRLLTYNQVREVITRYIDGETGAAIARDYGIDQITMNAIIRRGGYLDTQLPDHMRRALDEAPERCYSKLTDRDVEEIKALLETGMKQRDIARQYGVHEAMISRIKNGTRRANQ